ncbi:unnamed protein product [Ceratitis capitata]|uniref:(Mediterranean fruit fly) hypothetical protein n=1 Tax=Ceratitis capitata TaxID=7213 RepID=A0A811UVN3_CERCA|nr:unnamed protein product [Ceratitis capitata]
MDFGAQQLDILVDKPGMQCDATHYDVANHNFRSALCYVRFHTRRRYKFISVLTQINSDSRASTVICVASFARRGAVQQNSFA